MTMLFIDGFDGKDAATKWTPVTNMGLPNAVTYAVATRFGTGFAATPPNQGTSTGGPLFGTGSYALTRTFAPSAQVFLGAAVKVAPDGGQTYSSPFHVLAADTATTWHLYLVTTATGVVQLWRGDGHAVLAPGSVFTPNGTMVAASAAGVLPNAWHYVEMSATLNATTGAVVVKVDGTAVITFTGNTKNGGTSSSVDTVAFVGLSVFQSGPNTNLTPAAVDDLYVCNALGAVNNAFLGDIRVQTLLPTGAGSATGLAPVGSGTNWQNVNDVPDSAATYNGNTVSGHRDTYAMADLLASTGTVFAVQQVTDAFKSDSGAASIKAAQKSGATVSYGATVSLNTSLSTTSDLFETNPATSAAYTVADVNALEAGAEVV